MASRRALRDVTNASRANLSVPPGHLEKKEDRVQPLVSLGATNAENSVQLHPASIPARNEVLASVIAPVDNRDEVVYDRQSVVDNTPLSYQYSGHLDDIDERDRDDPLCVTEYVEGMYAYFRTKETSTSVQPVYMDNQRHINERMRAILVDWLVEVHLKFKLVPETLYLCVNLIDRFLKDVEVTRQKLQLVGVTCLLIASKYEDIYPPELRDLVYICDSAYTRNEILEMEETVLKALKYQITIPSAHAFLVRYLKAAHADKKMVQISCYILDGTLQSYGLLKFLPSELAAASVLLARRVVGRNSWSPTLLRYAKYREEDVCPVARAILAEKNSTPQELKAVIKKYTSSRYGGVANINMSIDF